MLNWFKKNKKKDSEERSLDGTYKIRWDMYYPTKQRFTPESIKTENTKLTLSGNHFDIVSPVESGEHKGYVMHEEGTFTLLKKESGQEVITFYVDGEGIFATGTVIRGITFTDINQFNIVDNRYRVKDYRFDFRKENEK